MYFCLSIVDLKELSSEYPKRFTFCFAKAIKKKEKKILRDYQYEFYLYEMSEIPYSRGALEIQN